MNVTMTVVGTERFLNRFEKSITDEWTLDNETYDKQVLLASIINKAGQLEPLYTDPRYFHEMCGFWWKKWNRTFQKWFDVFDEEYNPLWDRNGYEEVHEDTVDVLDNDTTYSKSGTVKEVTDDDYSIDKDTDVQSTTVNDVSAFDSTQYQPHDKSTVNSHTDEATTGTDDKTVDTTIGESGSGTDDSHNDRDFDRTYHSWGNWGISQTSQKLLESELKVQYWNIYEHISDIFCDEMLVRVYQ